MQAGELMERRQANWRQLESFCDRVKGKAFRRLEPSEVSQFASLYRSACTDLAMADTYQLPQSTTEYLHRLVGRAHNILYQRQRVAWSMAIDVVFTQAPQQIFRDFCVHAMALLFFGLFIVSAFCSYSESLFPKFAEQIIGLEMMDQMESMYEEPIAANFDHYIGMSAFYIQHNTSIGLKLFGSGPTIVWPVIELSSNAMVLGSVFGYMARPDVPAGDNFFQFVTAHGPFELTAIVLSAAAGLRIGIGLIVTAGLRRIDSLRVHAMLALPVIITSVILFLLAAFTEAVISPTAIPYPFKVLWAILSSCGLMIFFVVLGFPRSASKGESIAT